MEVKAKCAFNMNVKSTVLASYHLPTSGKHSIFTQNNRPCLKAVTVSDVPFHKAG
jgi:hypothetical protein